MAISTKDYKNVYGISFGGQHQRIANCMMLYNRPQYRTIFTPELIELGYGLRDGEVYGGSEAYLAAQGYADDPEWTPLTASNIISSGHSAISGSTKYYLTGDINVTFSDMVEDVEFTGIIDGCGYTINITANRNGSPNSNHCWGTLIGTLSGTIKNLKINTAFSWNSSKSSGYHQAAGGVIGRLGNGSNTTALIENCYITTLSRANETYHMNYTGRPTGGDHVYKCVGGIAGRMGWSVGGNGSIETPTVNIINTTVEIESYWWWKNSDGGSRVGRPDCGVCVGGFIGCQYAGTLNIINCSLKGTQNLFTHQQNGSDGGKTDLYKGGAIGKIGWNQSGSSNPPVTHFTNFKYSWTGNANSTDSGYGVNHYTAMVGHVYYKTANDNFSIENVYYTASSYAVTHGDLTWCAGQGADNSSSFIIHTTDAGPMYDESLENSIGFKRATNQTDYLWLGDISKISQRYLNTQNDGTGHDARGQFLYKVNFSAKSDGTTSFDPLGQSKFEKLALQNRYIALIIPSDISNTLKIDSIDYAKWAYLTNEQGTNAGTFKLYYDNGSYLDYTPPADFFNGRTSASGGRINIYEMNKYETINNQTYFITRNTSTGYYPVNTNNEE